jgi:hypothetical protein
MSTTTGTKGSDVYTFDGVNDPRLALYVLLVRGQTHDVIQDGLNKILYCSNTNIPDYEKLIEDAFVLAFMTRNIRGGKGERDLSMEMFKTLYNEKQEIMIELFKLIPHYGYWKDIFTIWEESSNLDIIKKLYDIVINQLENDEKNMLENKSISLLAKYIPRQTRQKNIAVHLANKLFPYASGIGGKLKLYRQKVVRLNKYLDTIEIKQCSKHWDDIKPESVPGRALAKYKHAFLNEKNVNKESSLKMPRYPNDVDRIKCAINFKIHMDSVIKGDAKVKAVDTTMPNEIYHSILISITESSDDFKNINRAQWKMISDDMKKGTILSRMIAMCDFSGSMDGKPKEVSAAMGILFSEITNTNKIMTFDSEPNWISFDNITDIYEKVQYLEESSLGQGLSTDFQKAMELIITDLKKNKTPLDQAPTDLVVFTDMAWDQACASNETSIYTGNKYKNHVKTDPWQTHVEMIRESFKRAGEDNFGEGQGYEMPRIIIWNLRADTNINNFHAQADTPGVLMYSGWSPSIFKRILKEGFKAQTPYDGLRQELDDPMYDNIRTIVRNVINKGEVKSYFN